MPNLYAVDDIGNKFEAILASIDRAEEVQPPPDDRELAHFRRNDFGNVQRLIVRHGYDLIHVDQLGWLVWDGRFWQAEDGNARALIKAHETAESIFEEAASLPEFEEEEPDPEQTELHAKWQKKKDAHDSQRRGLKKWALTSGNKGKTSAMVDIAAAFLRRNHELLDNQPWSFNVLNGTVRLNEGVTLYPHRRNDYLTKCADVTYNPDAEAPNWRKFISEILPDKDVAIFAQKWLGYCLAGDMSEQKTVQFEGKGANGKSTLLEVVARIMGNYAVTTPIETFLHQEKKSGSGPSPDIARLVGARLVRASEPEPGSRLSESQIKQFTGGEQLTARKLHKDFFEFAPQGKLTLSVNIRPVLVGKDHGIRRRILVLPFTQTFAKTGDDKSRVQGQTLVDRLLLEREGIFNWLLDGFRMWWEDGLDAPQAVVNATNAYFSEMDPIGSFVQEACTLSNDDKDWEYSGVLYEAYKSWCGEEPKNATAFGRRLTDLGVGRLKKGGKYKRLRITLRPEWRLEEQKFEGMY